MPERKKDKLVEQVAKNARTVRLPEVRGRDANLPPQAITRPRPVARRRPR